MGISKDSVWVRTQINKMYHVYAMLHPETIHDPRLRWEIDEESLAAFAREWGIEIPLGYDELIEFVKTEQPYFLGIKMNVIEQSGIRLVLTVE